MSPARRKNSKTPATKSASLKSTSPKSASPKAASPKSPSRELAAPKPAAPKPSSRKPSSQPAAPAAASPALRRCHYVLSTHWDREWYQTFQNYRYQLVQLIDHLLQGFRDGRLRGPFQTDGQAIILEDYLEIRPERRDEVLAHAKKGNFAIGPWYVMPDEFLVSGESLIRNLEYGRALARSMGAEPSNAGFVCDIFGHNSQMPQIFTLFGIRGGFIWRGTNIIHIRTAIWTGADGTELPCYRFGRIGYCDYAIDVRNCNRHDLGFDAERVGRNLDAFLDQEAELTDVDPILLFDGADHQDWDDDSYAVLAARIDGATPNAIDWKNFPYQIVHTTLDAYLAEMLPQASRIQERLVGELREPAVYSAGKDEHWLIPGVGSSRVKHKQANSDCETLLCQWAEPMSALAAIALGTEFPQRYLDVAWKWLIQNHPHDSICGCSIDQVHQDMLYRFSQCSQIADRLTREATASLAASIGGDVADNEIRVVVFNPLPRPVNEPVDVAIRVPTDWPKFAEHFGFEPKTGFTIHDVDGREIPYQRNGQSNNRTGYRLPKYRFSQGAPVNEIRVTLPLDLPAAGYTTILVRRGEERKPTRHPGNRGLATSHRAMENEFLSVAVEPNGTLTVVDKRTKQTYSDLLTFDDCADIGDGWYHGVAINDQIFSTAAARADVAIVHDGPRKTTLRIRTTMGLPRQFDNQEWVRAEDFADVVIDSWVTLRAGVDRIEVETTVHNAAEDHRMRVLFPSGANTDVFYADSPFDVVRRPIALREDNHLNRELEVEAKPMRSFAAVHDGKRGLAVISMGLLECAVQDRPERPLALTLFRSTRRTVLTNGQPDGLLLGELKFRYWIVPLTKTLNAARLVDLGAQLAAGFRAVHIAPPDVPIHRRPTALPPRAGLFRIEGEAVATSARQVGGAFEVRVFNPTEKAATVAIHLLDGIGVAGRFVSAKAVDFEGRPVDLAVDFSKGAKGGARITLKPKKIATIRFE